MSDYLWGLPPQNPVGDRLVRLENSERQAPVDWRLKISQGACPEIQSIQSSGEIPYQSYEIISWIPWKIPICRRRRRPQRELQRHLGAPRAPRALHGGATAGRSWAPWPSQGAGDLKFIYIYIRIWSYTYCMYQNLHCTLYINIYIYMYTYIYIYVYVLYI